MTTPPSDDLILRYLAGVVHGEEADVVRRYLDATPARRGIVAGLQEAMAVEVLRSGAPEKHASLEVVLARIAAEATGRSTRGTDVAIRGSATGSEGQERDGLNAWLPRGVSGLGNRIVREWTWIGGAMLAIAFIFLLGRPHVFSGRGVTQAYTTRIGERAIVTLSDGTHVTLAPQTTLRLAQFGVRSRSVTLEGEAYFEVTRAAGAPFIVHSGSMATRVLGTAFIVRHYPNDAHARVSVLTGKTQVSGPSATRAPVILTAGHVADVGDSTITIKTDRNIATDTRWMQGELLFHDTPLPDVLATLHRWYGYQFHCTDPALTRQVITVVLSTQSSAASLAILEQVLSANLTVIGDTVTLTRRPVQPAHGGARVRTYDVWTPNREAGR